MNGEALTVHNGNLTSEIDLGPLDRIPRGEGRGYVLSGRLIAVFRQRDGQLFASDGQCPHRAGPLYDGMIGAGKVVCPLHQFEFDLTTGRCAAEDLTLRTYAVRESNGRVLIEIHTLCD